MKSRPILFSAPMVRAILAGTKTQTRRIVRPDPDPAMIYGGTISCSTDRSQEGKHVWYDRIPHCSKRHSTRCPYGKPGDQLWVREEFYAYGHWQPIPGQRTKTSRQKWAFIQDSPEILFDHPSAYRKGRHHFYPFEPTWHKRLARFMPRKYSRITLQITDIRVERLQDITPDDCRAEGMPHDNNDLGVRYCYGQLWNQINGPGSWDLNPYVWAITFTRI